MNYSCDFLIAGGGAVGLTIAHQLLERKFSNKIIILDKEAELGLHSSGRNSGVIHAGIYYEPNSLKAKVCVSGAKRLKEWSIENGIKIKNCGKLIIPQKFDLDPQLDTLYARGKKNGAVLDFIGPKDIEKLVPEANITTGRALWSPNTSVINPKKVINRLQSNLKSKGIKIINSVNDFKLNKKNNELRLPNGSKIKYGYFINSAGLQADKVAHKFNVGLDYRVIPFKGIYWQLSKNCHFDINLNLYPVPDLNVPFLGVHFTPSANDDSVFIGPTAIPSLGRENYRLLDNIELPNTFIDWTFLAKQYLLNIDGFRKYVREQAFLGIPAFFLKSAQDLIPRLNYSHIERSSKVGIRAQLFNMKTNKIVKDFLCLEGEKSLHIISAISPAFTASFSFADLIIDNYLLKNINK